MLWMPSQQIWTPPHRKPTPIYCMPAAPIARRRSVTPGGGGSTAGTLDSVILAETSLINYYKLDEVAGSGTVADSKGSITGTVGAGLTLGSTSLTNDGATSALSAGAGNGSVTFSAHWSTGTNFSAECVMKLTALPTGSAQDFIFNGNGVSGNMWGLGVNSAGVLRVFCLVNSSKVFAFTVSINTVYHLVYTYNSTGQVNKLYVNGTLQDTISGSTCDNPTSAGAFLGQIGTAAGVSSIKGRFSKCALYNAVLTSTQVSTHYAAL